MFQKDSIKFKLIVVSAGMILLLMCLLFAFQFYSALTLESTIQHNTIRLLQDYSETEQRSLERDFENDILNDIEMMADALAQELYDLNRGSVMDKLVRFSEHPALCSIGLTDELTGEHFSGGNRRHGEGCILASTPILYMGERLGRLEATYNLKPLHLLEEQRRIAFDEALDKLHLNIVEVTHDSLLIQALIYLLAAALLIGLIGRQINRNIIRPLYCLLEDMRILKNNEQAVFLASRQEAGSDEIARLSRYFYEHIAALVRQLNQRANYDHLTLLYSRQKLIDDISNARRFNLAILDIDRFKEINNFLGIDAGDEFIKTTANLLRQHYLRKPYVLYRLNGDEFAIFDRNAVDLDLFERHVRQFVDSFSREELTVKGEVIPVSITAGITDNRHPSPIVAATTALKYAKLKKLKTAAFQDNLPIIKEYENNLQMTRIIRKAALENLVIPYYQPIQDLKTGTIVKYEALIRISDAAGHIHTPESFLDISKRSGIYKELSLAMIRKAIASLSTHDCQVGINLSAQDTEDADISRLLEELYGQYGSLHRVMFEMTEQEGFSNPEIVHQFIRRTQRYGAKFAIDDFGSGYSNFENLIHFEVDYLKIDGSLIRNITTNRNSEIVVETIIAFARKLGIQTIAEFVSDASIHAKVQALGVDYAQGYYIGRPVPSIAPPDIDATPEQRRA